MESNNCVEKNNCVDCLVGKCFWVVHTKSPSVCMHNYRLSPYEVDFVVEPGSVCPPVPEPQLTGLSVAIFVPCFLLAIGLGAGFFWGFTRAMIWWRGRGGQQLVEEIMEEQRQPRNVFQEHENRQVEARIENMAALVGLPNNRENRERIQRVDERLGWRPDPYVPNREEGNRLLDVDEHEMVELAAPARHIQQVRRRRPRMPEALRLLADNPWRNEPMTTRSCRRC